MLELECKLTLPDPERILRILRETGAADHGCVFEQNWVYDREGELLVRQELLRLRVTNYNQWGIVTHKRPSVETAYKCRVETECRVEDAGQMRVILESLGYRTEWFYEKYRHSWTHEGCEVVIDLLPELGHFIEIEAADEASIDRMLVAFGLDKQQNLLASYRQIWIDHCAKFGRPVGEWRFPLDFRPGNTTI